MKNNLYFLLFISFLLVLKTFSLKSQNCYENSVVFKTDSMTLESFQYKCLDYNIRVYKTFKKHDIASKLNLVLHTCKNDLIKNNLIGIKRLEILRSYIAKNYSINDSDIESIDKSDSVKTGFCNNYGGLIEFKVTMTKPISKKLSKKIKRLKV